MPVAGVASGQWAERLDRAGQIGQGITDRNQAAALTLQDRDTSSPSAGGEGAH